MNIYKKVTMKLRKSFWGVLASLTLFAACEEPQQNLGVPDISLSVTELEFSEAGGEKELAVKATRDWMVEADADWLVVSPESGTASSEAYKVTVTTLENTGFDREASLKFTIGMKSKYLTVTQKGPGGSTEALVVYYNDYDKEEATKTYGSGESWPYLDQFDGWMNQIGTGAANVEYAYSGMSARANSTSNSSYSDYEGSGKNNMFFGKSAYLATKNIALGGATDFTLTFGTEKYSQDNGSVFTKSEYHIYVSNDAAKWVEITDYTFAGEGTEGRWNVATADFSVPAGTENLSICIKVDVASSYRMDDFRLVVSGGGDEVDFSKGVEMDFTAGGNGGGSTTAPESKGKKTVEEFIAAADESNYYELTGKVSGFNPTYCSFDLTDATGEVYVYSVLEASKAQWSGKISNGGTITIYGKYLYYEQKSQHEVVDAYIVDFKADGSGSTGGNETEKPGSLIKATVAEFLAAPESQDTWYELTGEITSIVSGNVYGNLYINDGTAEVYIYGLTNGWVGYNDKSFDSIGLKVGDTVTLGTLRGSYNGEPQGGGSKVPAYYISHIPGEGGSTGGEDISEASWSYTFAEGDLGSTGSLLENVTLNGVTWTFVMNDADFLGYDSQSGRGLQMGKKADPATSISLSTEGISGTIKKIVVNSAGASGTDAKLVVKVGESEFGSPVNITKSSEDYVFEGSASGKIELNWTLSAAAVYIKSIAVYTE